MTSPIELLLKRRRADWPRWTGWAVRLGAGAAGFAAVALLHLFAVAALGAWRAPGFGGAWFCAGVTGAALVVLADRRLRKG